MARNEIRKLKRMISFGGCNVASAFALQQARDASLKLLCRSIAFGHRRIALMRLLKALQSGATVTSEQWAYCERSVANSVDTALQIMLSEAKKYQNQDSSLKAPP